MNRALRLVWSALCILCLVSPARSAEPMDELNVRVLVVRGDVVEIDLGADAGARPGDVVVFRPLGLPESMGRVRSTQAGVSIVAVEGGTENLAPGVAGVLRVPSGRFEPGEEDRPATPPIEWSSQEGPWEEGVPLLAPVESPSRADRPTSWIGRATLGAFWLNDDGALPREDRIGWLGFAATGSNPFGAGGELNVATELRSNDLTFDDPALEADDGTYVRVDALSYAFGGTRDRASRIEAGRFLSRSFPELGFVDGVEASHRTRRGIRFGVLAGMQPAIDRERSFEDAPQVALWSRVPFGADDRGELGVAVKKTWYEGESDRDLVVARGRWSSRAWRFDASTWIDHYADDDAGKDEGLELTEARVGVTRTLWKRGGVRIAGSRIRFPSVRRIVNQTLLDDRRSRAEVDTFRLATWIPAGRGNTWNARAGAWQDEDDDGGWIELGFMRARSRGALRRWSIDAFVNDDPGQSVVGGRARVGGPAFDGSWSLALEVGQYARAEGIDADDELLGAIRANWTGEVASGWLVQVGVTARLGDEQDATSLDASLTRSF